jgi:hypothetical protein
MANTNTTYTIKGKIKDSVGNPLRNVKVEAMDSDQNWFEDHNDDLIDSKWVSNDGTFEIPFDRKRIQEGWLEGNPDIYLMVRNPSGQIIHRTQIRRGVNISDTENLYFEITLNTVEKQQQSSQSSIPDPYLSNNQRVIAAFGRLADVSEFQIGDIARILSLLGRSINAWSLYTTEYMWKATGYDGPQVPKYPWREPGHSHELRWDREQRQNAQ